MRGLREQPARVLANRPLEAAGKCSTGRGPVLAQRPHRPEAEHSMDPALGQPGPDLPGLELYCPVKGLAAGGMCRYARASHRLNAAWVFPWAAAVWRQTQVATPLPLGLN